MALGLIGQLLEKMIPTRRMAKPKPKNDPGYYALNERELIATSTAALPLSTGRQLETPRYRLQLPRRPACQQTRYERLFSAPIAQNAIDAILQ
jgi:hypothetical protein